MAEDRSLLAYLVPKITNRREDTATDALAFILNKSDDCRQAFNDLLRGSGYELEPVGNFRTQVTYEDGSRPDMVGYDKEGAKRLIVESKFWASLGKGQTKGYLDQLEDLGPGVLLYIAPSVRMETLWAEIARRMRKDNMPLESVRTGGQLRTAKVAHSNKRLMLVSWMALLNHFCAAVPNDSPVASDISQLRSLALLEDEEAFQPIADEELSPSIAQRIRWLHQLIDDAIDARGVENGWMSIEGTRATSVREGYGRYFKFANAAGWLFLGVNFWRWATSANTPLWLWMDSDVRVNVDRLEGVAPELVADGYIPIHLKTGAEYEAVLDDVTLQLKQIHNALKPNNEQ